MGQARFGYYDDDRHKLRRNQDPATSKQGAADAARRLGEMQERTLLAVRAYPGRTCAELEDQAGVMGRTFGRRLGELEKAGRVERGRERPCSITKRRAATWRIPTPEA